MEQSKPKVFLSFSIENILRGSTSAQPQVHKEAPAAQNSLPVQPRTSSPVAGATPPVSPIPVSSPWSTDSLESDSPPTSESDISIEMSNDENSDQVATKTKKLRTNFTVGQVKELEALYAMRRYLPACDRKKVASKLNLADQQVKTWFQNRRMKEKRTVRESDKIAALAPLPSLRVAVHPSPLGVMNQNPTLLPRYTDTSAAAFPQSAHFQAPITVPQGLPMPATTTQPSWSTMHPGEHPVNHTDLLNALPVGAISAAQSHGFSAMIHSSCSSGLLSTPVYHNSAILTAPQSRYV